MSFFEFINCLWLSHLFESVGLCLLPNVGNFQPLLLRKNFQPHPLPFFSLKLQWHKWDLLFCFTSFWCSVYCFQPMFCFSDWEISIVLLRVYCCFPVFCTLPSSLIEFCFVFFFQCWLSYQKFMFGFSFYPTFANTFYFVICLKHLYNCKPSV